MAAAAGPRKILARQAAAAPADVLPMAPTKRLEGRGENTMWLLIVYVGLVLVGDVADYLIGLVVEQMWGPQVSLVVFLVLYFVFLWVAWVIAVKITAPSAEPKTA